MINKKLTFIISSRNNESNLIKLLDSYCNNSELVELTNMIIVNDCSDFEYSLIPKKIKDFTNITYSLNSVRKGKVSSFIEVKQYVKTDFVCLIDDKDIFINYQEWIDALKQINLSNSELYCFYMCNANLKIIGNEMSEIDNYYNFYIKKGLIGDHVFFISNNYYKNFELPIEFKNKVINNELFFFKDIFNINYLVLSNLPLLLHDYEKGNITKNLMNHKIYDWEVTFYTANLILKNKPCLKIKIINLFYLFLIRKNKHFFNTLDNKNKFIYLIMYLSFSFLLIKKLYIKKLNKIVE